MSAPKHVATETDEDITDVASAESTESDSDSPTTLHELKSSQYLSSKHIQLASLARLRLSRNQQK